MEKITMILWIIAAISLVPYVLGGTIVGIRKIISIFRPKSKKVKEVE